MINLLVQNGDAVWEGLRLYNGRIFKLTEHSERLIAGAKIMDFEIPYSVAEIDQACRDTVAANNLVDCYVRPLAWRGSEQMGVSAQNSKIHLAIAATLVGLMLRILYKGIKA